MPVSVKKVQTTDKRFSSRKVECAFAGTVGDFLDVVTGKEPAATQYQIPVPDTVVLCNGCNQNLYPDAGYLVYLGKRELKADQPYNIYCEACLKRYFKDYKEV